MQRYLDQPDVLDLERWRDQLADRLTQLCRNTDPFHVEGVHFTDWRHASVRRGQLTETLLDNIETLNAEIRRILYPHLTPSTPACLTDRVMREVSRV
jgi:hypothetical protein